jgi:hypothetical protein
LIEDVILIHLDYHLYHLLLERGEQRRVIFEEEPKAAALWAINRLVCCVDVGKEGESCRGELEEEGTLSICCRPGIVNNSKLIK